MPESRPKFSAAEVRRILDQRGDASKNTAAQWLSPGVLEVTWRGEAAAAEIQSAFDAAVKVVGESAVDYILCETTDVTGYSVSVRKPSIDFLHHFKKKGVKEFVAVIPNMSIRMFVASVSFLTQARTKLFETRDQALRYLESKKSG